MATTPGTILTGRDGTGAGFGSSVAIAGDLDRDGYAGIAIVGTF